MQKHNAMLTPFVLVTQADGAENITNYAANNVISSTAVSSYVTVTDVVENDAEWRIAA